MKREYKFESLPKWAQERMTKLECELDIEKDKLSQVLPCVEKRHNWFIISNPNEYCKFPDDIFRLFVLQPDRAHPVCVLTGKDKLIVVRGEK